MTGSAVKKAAAKHPRKYLSKSKFSAFLRTKCDRELYLSLFKDADECQKAGIPVPLKSRPGVQLITKSGTEFELEQYDELIRAIPKNVFHKSNGTAPVDPEVILSVLGVSPAFILQPAIEPEEFRNVALDNLNLSAADKALIPQMAGLKPDVLYVDKPHPNSFEVMPDGSRKRINPGDTRLAISVVDLKNVTEGNPSYAAEVCLYAFFFANWLALQPKLKDRYFVSDRVFLWKNTEMLAFKQAFSLASKTDPESRIAALLQDLEEGLVDYLIYMPSVKKFFQEDVPRVISLGDTEGWSAVNYHVNPRCSTCEWLGNPDWLNPKDAAIYKANPDHYCAHAAESADHLCKMAGLSQGAAQILGAAGHKKVASLVKINSSEAVLKKHALLKRDKSQLGHRAEALQSGTHSVETEIKVGGLAKNLNAEYDIVVNFDAGAGLLTGIALRGILFAPYQQAFKQADGSKKTTFTYPEEVVVNPKDTDQAEWVTLQEFITKFAGMLTNADKVFQANAWGPVHTQLCFWELRQYEELCNAFGRHLMKVLDLPEKEQRALAWIFPAEELMERDMQLAPGIVFIRDIIDAAIRLPVKFANTLLGVAEAYHLPVMTPRSVDKYYREPLGNAIPRERIFEIWKSLTGTVPMFGKQISTTEAIKKYGDVLKAHTWALGSVTARLRNDIRKGLEGHAPALKLSEISGATGVAHDSKLWIQWDMVSSATAEIEAKAELIASPDHLESSYKAIVLTKLINKFGNHRYEFEVNEESTEAKLEEGSYFILGIVDQVGYPLLTPYRLGISGDGGGRVHMPLHRIINVTLEQFDRVNRRAVISVAPSWGRSSRHI